MSDELIEIHHGKCAEQFAKQQEELERLHQRIADLLNEKDELNSKMYSWRLVAETFNNFNENNHNDNCGFGSVLTKQKKCYCGYQMFQKTKEALDER